MECLWRLRASTPLFLKWSANFENSGVLARSLHFLSYSLPLGEVKSYAGANFLPNQAVKVIFFQVEVLDYIALYPPNAEFFASLSTRLMNPKVSPSN